MRPLHVKLLHRLTASIYPRAEGPGHGKDLRAVLQQKDLLAGPRRKKLPEVSQLAALGTGKQDQVELKCVSGESTSCAA